jgi:hypothetical protein
LVLDVGELRLDLVEVLLGLRLCHRGAEFASRLLDGSNLPCRGALVGERVVLLRGQRVLQRLLCIREVVERLDPVLAKMRAWPLRAQLHRQQRHLLLVFDERRLRLALRGVHLGLRRRRRRSLLAHRS